MECDDDDHHHRKRRYRAGDCVHTLYGAGVVTAHDRENSLYSVRLWRIPGRSVGSSAAARLTPPSILGPLPAAPGMITYMVGDGSSSSEGEEEEKIQVLVHSYYSDRNVFMVSKLRDKPAELSDDDDDSKEKAPQRRRGSLLFSRDLQSFERQQQPPDLLPVTADQLVPIAPSAQFYPVLESLMARAEHAATAASQLLRSPATRRAVGTCTGQVWQETAGQWGVRHDDGGDDGDDDGSNINNDHDRMDRASRKLEDLAHSVEAAAPGIERGAREVLAMIRDEDVTALLERCRTRLRQLKETDLPRATRQALEKTGIRIDLQPSNNSTAAADGGTTTTTSTLTESVAHSRRAALTAIDELLRQAELAPDLEHARADLAQNFARAFESLSTAAKSDRDLHDLFESVQASTTVWQEATGRLAATRSGGLFLEGASRIQQRAAAIFGKHADFSALGEIGSRLTKSFTEGDAALARLKSIELGDAVKSRLVDAIEVRSESSGGLDGIIAGALTAVQFGSDGGGANRIQDLLQRLQQTASSTTRDAHETLLAVLSSRSAYRDHALLRIEQALCDLGDQMGPDLAPDQIAALVRGEGGTAKLFEPIAQRALQQIEKQLDAAEAQVQDATVLEVLSRVRKIMSGELTLTAVMDDIVNVLNDDKVVAAGESFVQQSEQVLDAIEGVSANKAVTDALQLVEKAGITKDSVMREFEKLNVDDLLGAAGDAVRDERARRKLLSKATDTALDFVLRVLPSMPVPPFEGVKDGLVYHISNLSMKGFRVKKEDIQIELAGIRATKKHKVPEMANVPTPDVGQNGVSSLPPTPTLKKSASTDSSFSSTGSEYSVEEIHSNVKATELLIIDIRNVSAVLDNALWSFEQTYLPYLKGKGAANVRLSGGAIRLQFELRKRRKEKAENAAADGSPDLLDWEPVLCLRDRSCAISEVDLTMEGGGKIAWIVNTLAGIFKGVLRDYVVSTIVKVLSSKSGWLLARLNGILAPYWELIQRTAKLSMDDLVEAGDDVIVTELPSTESKIVELVWRERLPLGMNLLMNDDDGVLKVADFPRGSQARSVCERRKFDPDAFKGASVVAVNGTEYFDQEELFEALKDPGRPKTVGFRLAESAEAERLRKFLEGDTPPVQEKRERVFRLRKVVFEEPGELGIGFGAAVDNSCLVVTNFVEGDGGIIFAAERSGDVKIGDLLTHINDEPVLRKDGDGCAKAISALESAGAARPLTLTFTEPHSYQVEVVTPEKDLGVDGQGGPSELVLVETQDAGKRRITVQGFEDVSGRAESSNIFIGDHLVFINGIPVGAACRWFGVPSAPTMEEVLGMIRDPTHYPIGLTFARPVKQAGSRWKSRSFSDSEAETVCVTADSPERLGCQFGAQNEYEVVVTDFLAVPGVYQRAMDICKDENGGIQVSIDSINGQFVPSYATIDLVRNALNRSWKESKSTVIRLCDDERKHWLYAQLQNAQNES